MKERESCSVAHQGWKCFTAATFAHVQIRGEYLYLYLCRHFLSIYVFLFCSVLLCSFCFFVSFGLLVTPSVNLLVWESICYLSTSSTARRSGGSLKDKESIGEVGCCESCMAEPAHWCSSIYLSFLLSFCLPSYLCIYLSIYLSIYLCMCYVCIYLSRIFLSIQLSV